MTKEHNETNVKFYTKEEFDRLLADPDVKKTFQYFLTPGVPLKTTPS